MLKMGSSWIFKYYQGFRSLESGTTRYTLTSFGSRFSTFVCMTERINFYYFVSGESGWIFKVDFFFLLGSGVGGRGISIFTFSHFFNNRLGKLWVTMKSLSLFGSFSNAVFTGERVFHRLLLLLFFRVFFSVKVRSGKRRWSFFCSARKLLE